MNNFFTGDVRKKMILQQESEKTMNRNCEDFTNNQKVSAEIFMMHYKEKEFGEFKTHMTYRMQGEIETENNLPNKFT